MCVLMRDAEVLCGLMCALMCAGACQVQSFEQTICVPCDQEWGVGATGTWVQLFCLSKIPELFDTFFIVQRKRPLIFLHW